MPSPDVYWRCIREFVIEIIRPWLIIFKKPLPSSTVNPSIACKWIDHPLYRSLNNPEPFHDNYQTGELIKHST